MEALEVAVHLAEDLSVVLEDSEVHSDLSASADLDLLAFLTEDPSADLDPLVVLSEAISEVRSAASLLASPSPTQCHSLKGNVIHVKSHLLHPRQRLLHPLLLHPLLLHLLLLHPRPLHPRLHQQLLCLKLCHQALQLRPLQLLPLQLLLLQLLPLQHQRPHARQAVALGERTAPGPPARTPAECAAPSRAVVCA